MCARLGTVDFKDGSLRHLLYCWVRYFVIKIAALKYHMGQTGNRRQPERIGRKSNGIDDKKGPALIEPGLFPIVLRVPSTGFDIIQERGRFRTELVEFNVQHFNGLLKIQCGLLIGFRRAGNCLTALRYI